MRNGARSGATIGTDYARDVVAGEVLACRFVKLACQRHLDDLARQDDPEFPFHFDAKAADKVVRFVELLPHVKGRWAREHQMLAQEPWQCFVDSSVFGWLRKSDDKRRYRTVYIEVPRKNGKSVKAAATGLYCFAADGEYGAEVYSGATTEKQAWEVFRPARLMAAFTPELCAAFGIGVNAKNLHIDRTASRFEPIIGNPGDGSSPSMAIVDEYHEHQSGELYDTMLTGMGAREQPLLYVITTAGSDTSGPCYALRDQVVQMLEGRASNDQLFGIIYTIDEGDDWTSDEAMRKANPNLGVSVSEEFVRGQIEEGRRVARRQNVVKTKHLNVWTSAAAAWMNMEAWNRQADPTLKPEQFAGEPCYSGLDLASKIDLTAAMKIFRRPVDGEDHYYLFGRYYLPEARAEDPRNAHYQGWATDGHLILTDGEELDYERVEEDLRDDDAQYGIALLGFDPFGATELAQRLGKEGVPTVEVLQRAQYLSEPMKWLEALTLAGRLHHDGNPVLAWGMSNVVVRELGGETLYPRKERPEKKIDPAVATMIALRGAFAGEVTTDSVYNERGLIVL